MTALDMLVDLRLDALLRRLVIRKGVVWNEYQKDVQLPKATLEDGQIATSELADGSGHMLILDVDFPVYVVPSSTPGHNHIYFDSPKPISQATLREVLASLADAGIIENGYKSVSVGRGFTALRLPWIRKGEK